MQTLVYSIPIDTIEMLRQQGENDATATTIRRYVGRVEESFRRRLHLTITAVTLNTSCND
jgi:hypothetical protein